MVDKLTFESLKGQTGCGLGLRIKKVPLSPRGEELAKERKLIVIEDNLQGKNKKGQ